jgi:hypothetical protein
MKPKKKYIYRKYDGDDKYSWAIFYAAECVKFKGIVFYGQAKPIVSGCSLAEAKWRTDELNNKVENPVACYNDTILDKDLIDKRKKFVEAANNFLAGK